MKLSELSIGKLHKDGEFNWLGLTAENYEGKRVLTFLANIKFYAEIEQNPSISCIITTSEIANKLPDNDLGVIVAEKPKISFFQLHNKLAESNFYYEIKTNCISEKAYIMEGAQLIGSNIIIEDNVLIEPNVTICGNTHIKKDSVIKAGTTVSGAGFQMIKDGDTSIAVTSIGKVIIGKNVVIQNNCCIDKGVFSDTELQSEVKLDNLVHVAHDVKIDQNSFLAAGTVLSGRVKIGKNVFFGPNCTVSNGLSIGNNSQVTLGAVVTRDVPENTKVSGNFAVEHGKFMSILKSNLRK